LAALYEGVESHPRVRLVKTISGGLRVYYVAPP
jgi:hypothetical protein